jgi:hypothetical protein
MFVQDVASRQVLGIQSRCDRCLSVLAAKEGVRKLHNSAVGVMRSTVPVTHIFNAPSTCHPLPQNEVIMCHELFNLQLQGID